MQNVRSDHPDSPCLSYVVQGLWLSGGRGYYFVLKKQEQFSLLFFPKLKFT